MSRCPARAGPLSWSPGEHQRGSLLQRGGEDEAECGRAAAPLAIEAGDQEQAAARSWRIDPAAAVEVDRAGLHGISREQAVARRPGACSDCQQLGPDSRQFSAQQLSSTRGAILADAEPDPAVAGPPQADEGLKNRCQAQFLPVAM